MKTIPIACDMSVFSPEERESHIKNTRQLYQSVLSIREVENGYEFAFPGRSEFILGLGEFISNERLCCPFLKFNLLIPPADDPVTMTLSGPEGTKEFLREEFSEIFA